MTRSYRIGTLVIVALCLGLPAAAEAIDPRAALQPRNIAGMRINLNPGGAELGFELEATGGDPRFEPLLEVIRESKPGGGHKCPNSGAIRFWTKDGRLVGVGLLRSHTVGDYELRVYDGDRYVAAYRVDRSDLLNALALFGVPADDPAFRE